LRQISEIRAVCVRSACTDLCGGCRVTGIPTATGGLSGRRFPQLARRPERPPQAEGLPHRLLSICALFLSLGGCGYHVAGKADLMPKSVHTIFVPAFSNVTASPTLTDSLPEAISRELIARTRFQVVHDEKDADAVLRGTVINVQKFPIVYDVSTGRASGAQINVVLRVSLIDRGGKELYSRPNYEYRERYRIGTDPRTYFDESVAALQRLSGEAARDIVSGILENF